MDWQTFDHEADVGVRGTGATLAEAFAGAATALTASICDPATVQPLEAVTIECTAPDIELLLVDWLNAVVFEMATRHMLFSRFDVEFEDNNPEKARQSSCCRLQAMAWGEPVDLGRHRPAAEVKGVSFCELKVGRQPDGQWLAQTVVDV